MERPACSASTRCGGSLLRRSKISFSATLKRQFQNDPLTAEYRSAWGKTGEPGAAITGTMQGIETNITHPNMNISERTSMRQRLKAVQGELIEGLDAGMGAPTTPTLERLVHILDWLRVEELVADGCGMGHPPREPSDRSTLAVV